MIKDNDFVTGFEIKDLKNGATEYTVTWKVLTGETFASQKISRVNVHPLDELRLFPGLLETALIFGMDIDSVRLSGISLAYKHDPDTFEIMGQYATLSYVKELPGEIEYKFKSPKFKVCIGMGGESNNPNYWPESVSLGIHKLIDAITAYVRDGGAQVEMEITQ